MLVGDLFDMKWVVLWKDNDLDDDRYYVDIFDNEKDAVDLKWDLHGICASSYSVDVIRITKDNYVESPFDKRIYGETL